MTHKVQALHDDLLLGSLVLTIMDQMISLLAPRLVIGLMISYSTPWLDHQSDSPWSDNPWSNDTSLQSRLKHRE